MKFNQHGAIGGNSSSFYKQKSTARKTFLQKVAFYAQSMGVWFWNLMRKWGWIISSGFIILVLPSVVMQMLEYENLYAKEMAYN